MTSEEIKRLNADARTIPGWLREIAYQLARINESAEPFVPLAPLSMSSKPIKRK